MFFGWKVSKRAGSDAELSFPVLGIVVALGRLAPRVTTLLPLLTPTSRRGAFIWIKLKKTIESLPPRGNINFKMFNDVEWENILLERFRGPYLFKSQQENKKNERIYWRDKDPSINNKKRLRYLLKLPLIAGL